MLTQYGGYPAFDVMYDMGGHLVDPTAETDAATYFGTGDGKNITDIIVISHGWNNDISEAHTLYQNFFNAFAPVPDALRNKGGRKFGVVALFWPSKRFADSDLIPGGAAGLVDPAATQVLAQLDLFEDMFAHDPAIDAKIAHLKSIVPILNISANAQDDYVSTLTSMVPLPRYEADEGLDNARQALNTVPGRVVLQNLATPFASPTAPLPGSGGAAGLVSGITSAAATLGDLLTYYTMKDRAGIVGRTGAVGTLRALLKCRGASGRPRIHLAGHSFGGRLVTSAANALNGSSVTPPEFVDSKTLLEAAYSHNGLAKNWDGRGNDGAFRSVITQVKVKGPIIISHSSHDFPVGTAYPIASRLRGQVGESLIGGPDDIYGGMGRNGAQHTPEISQDVALAPTGSTGSYPPAPTGSPCWGLNIRGDGPPPAPTITGHGDVAKPELATVMLNYI
jgi:hypothetical protein